MDETPGWAAIDDALARIHDAEPLHWGTVIKWALGGPDPLDGISAYASADPVPHWHYVTYGMSELYTKESDLPDVSGWGFEFTFRLARDPGEGEPPLWPANLLQNLARYVFRSGNTFEPGHHMSANGPIAAERTDSAIRAIVFALDPELGEIATPHGSLRFLQVVGVTDDEYQAALEWNSGGLLELLAPRLPALVTDIDRGSLLADPEVAAAVRAGIERDGSSSSGLFVDVAAWERGPAEVTVRFGALPADRIAQGLRGRLPYGHGFLISADDRAVGFRPADTFFAEPIDEATLDIGVPAAALPELIAAFRPVAGRTPVASLPGLVIEIEPTHIKDQDGEPTGEVIG
jgi:suppressor of fused-like protein